MDWEHPERTWAGELAGPVLYGMWRAGRPLTGLQVHRVAEVGTAGGVRYALLRLMEHGIVDGERIGASVLYRLNEEHLAYEAMVAAFERLHVWSEFEERVHELRGQHYGHGSTDPLPVVAVFGSVARGEARLDSDVDLLVIVANRDSQDEKFADTLAVKVKRWTGQPAQVYLTTPAALAEARQLEDPIVENFRRDARVIAGRSLEPYLTGVQ